MKKFIAMTAAIVLSGMVVESHAEEVSADKFCGTQHSLAESIMSARQRGVSMPAMMEKTDESMFRAIIIEAFDRPRFNTKEIQQRTIADFANGVYLTCVKAFRRNEVE